MASCLIDTCPLTIGTDTGAGFTGGAGDDTFTAVVNSTAGTSGTSLNAGDSITGGAGTDKLQVIISGTPAPTTTQGFFSNGVETINIQNVATALQTVDLANATGVKTIELVSSNQATTVSNVAAIADVNLNFSDAALTVGYAAAAVAGTADTAKVSLNGAATAGAASVSQAGIETVAVTLTGQASGNASLGTAVNIAGANITKVTVAGDVGGRLSTSLSGAAATSSTTVGTVDASATKGGVTLDVTGAGGQYIAVTGGTGNDTVAVGTLSTNSTLAGGDGTDTLSVNALAGGANDFKNVTGFEAIRFGSGVTASQNLANAGTITSVVLGSTATGAAAVTGLASGASVTFGANNAAGAFGVSINNAATNTTDELTVAVGTSSSTSNIDAGTLTASGVETIKLSSNSKAEITAGNHAIVISDAALKTLTITGNESLVVTGGSTTITSVDASAATSHISTAGLTVSGTAVTILGGAGNDSINGGAGNDVLTSNAGNDSIIAGAGNDVISAGDGNDTIDFGAGTDSVDGGAGNDAVMFTAGDLSSSDTIAGGDGSNVLRANNTMVGNALTDSAFTNVTGIQTLSAASANTGTIEATLSTKAQAAGLTTVSAFQNSTTGVFNANSLLVTVQEGFTNALTFKLGATGGVADNINAGATTATVTVSGDDSAFGSTDTIIGGSNAGDSLVITATGGAANISKVSGVETVTIAANGTTPASTTSLTVGSADVLQSGKTLVVNASALTNDAAAFTFNASAEADDGTNTGKFNVTSGAGADNLTGGAGADTFTTGAGNDSVTAGAGADTITTEAGNDYVDGGAGNDVVNTGTGNDTLFGGTGTDNLTGGDGNDIYSYGAVSESASGNASSFAGDTIVGFNAGDGTTVADRLQLPAGWTTVNTITTVTIGSANLTTLQDDLSTNGNLTTALNTAGKVAVLTVSGGTAAGTYIVANNGAGAYNSSNSIIVKLDGATNLDKLSVNNFSGFTTSTYTVAGFNAAEATINVSDLITVADTSANIGTNLAALLANSKVDTIDSTENATAFNVTAAQATSAKLVAGDSITAADTSAC